MCYSGFRKLNFSFEGTLPGVPSAFWGRFMATRRKQATKIRHTASDQAAKPLDVVRLREEIDRLVRAHAIEMVEKTIDDVNQGRYLAMRFLFEMTGIYPAPVTEEGSAEGETLARTLLERLGLLSDEELETSTSGGISSPAAAECDAVE